MRKSISTAFFSLVSTLMVLGIVLMGCSEWVLFKSYFAKERYETLDQVVNVAKRTAEYLVNREAMPQGAELDALNTKLEIIGESAEAYLFFTDRQGNVLIASDLEKLTTTTVPLDICRSANAVADPDACHYHAFTDLGGALTEKSYVSVVQTIDDRNQLSGWLFLCSSGAQLTAFKQQFWSNFLMSACVMLLCASVLTRLLMRKLTDPLQKVTDAAQRFGGGDLSVRVEGVEGEGEVANLARTFNQMAENIQSNDNSQGQFMGNIAHELRTGGAQKQPAADRALSIRGLHHRDIAFFGQCAAQVAESVVVFGVRVCHCVGAPADIQRHGGGGKRVRVGGDEHIALSVREEQISLGALTDDLQFGVQSVQLCTLRHGLAVYQILCGALGNVYQLIQRFVAILRKIILEQHPLRAAHQHDAQHHQGGHHGEKGRGDTFTHY